MAVQYAKLKPGQGKDVKKLIEHTYIKVFIDQKLYLETWVFLLVVPTSLRDSTFHMKAENKCILSHWCVL